MFIFSLFIISVVLHFCSLKDKHLSADKCSSIVEVLSPGCLGVAAARDSLIQNISAEGFSNDNNSINRYDDFENHGTYTLSDGQISPNGKWKVAYTGFGSVGVQQDPNTGNQYFFEQPKAATSKNDTRASMVLTTQQYSDFEMDLDMKTVAQLRKNSAPNTWETAWVFWHYTDEFHYYALTLKTDGLQIEKKDNNNRDDSAEIYLKFSNTPKLKFNKWINIKLNVTGKHITLWADGKQVLGFTDESAGSPVMSHGYIGLYNEDAKVNFDNVNIKDISHYS
jgi:Domain of Unknown Function (DUF1080)